MRTLELLANVFVHFLGESVPWIGPAILAVSFVGWVRETFLGRSG
jgi:hypothetical protein